MASSFRTSNLWHLFYKWGSGRINCVKTNNMFATGTDKVRIVRNANQKCPIEIGGLFFNHDTIVSESCTPVDAGDTDN